MAIALATEEAEHETDCRNIEKEGVLQTKTRERVDSDHPLRPFA
jgi:hypothetical protein